MLKRLPNLPVIFHNVTRFSPVSPYVSPPPHTITQPHFSFALQASALTRTLLDCMFSPRAHIMPKQRKSRSSQRTTVQATTAQPNARANSDSVRTNADRNTTFTFVPEPPGAIRATAAAHRSPPSERFSGLHIPIYRPSDHTGSTVGLHDCLYRGAKTGNLQLREKLAIELIWCC